ncbi:pyridoxal-phosphate dependent enzyme [Shouchella sp. 1P09AA]|uniref:pyridoxal-phosphate dependent enzyme n=1 Tax=unclassified Shouchella TaxID=2893065 RepID=UPI0039A1C472
MLMANTMSGYICIKCGKRYPISNYYKGCIECLNNGYPSSLSIEYKDGFELYNWLPFISPITLGEGNTPLIKNLVDGFDNIIVKNESTNPTGSHKDRISSYTISSAISQGYKGVVVASSGNAALSISSYAAYAGIKCVVISTKALDRYLQKVLKKMSAEVILVEQSLQRWELMKKYVNEGYYPATNYINPPVGSQPIGVQSFKNISREIFLQLNHSVPNKIVVPTSRGDLFWGIYEGFNELYNHGFVKFIPQMVAVEPFPRAKKVLNGASYTDHFNGSTNLYSINGQTVTYQLIKAIEESRGEAFIVDEEDAKREQHALLKKGLNIELSSATVMSVAKKISKNNGLTLAILTSSATTPVLYS